MGKREQVLQLYSSKGCYEIHYPRWPTCNPTLTITRHQYMYFCHRQAKACDTRLLLLAWAGWGLGMRLTEWGGEGEMNKLRFYCVILTSRARWAGSIGKDSSWRGELERVQDASPGFWKGIYMYHQTDQSKIVYTRHILIPDLVWEWDLICRWPTSEGVPSLALSQ